MYSSRVRASLKLFEYFNLVEFERACSKLTRSQVEFERSLSFLSRVRAHVDLDSFAHLEPLALIAPNKSAPSFRPPSDGSILLDPIPRNVLDPTPRNVVMTVEMTSTGESMHIPSSLTFSGSQELACLRLTCPRLVILVI